MRYVIETFLFSVMCFCQLACGGQATVLQQQSNVKTSSPQGSEANNTTLKKEATGAEHFGRANGLKYGGEGEAALIEYNLAIKTGFDTSELRYELGELFENNLKRSDEAIEQYRIAVQHNPAYWRGHWALAQMYLKTEQYSEALSELQIVKRLDSKGVSTDDYALFTAKAFDGLKRYDQALKDYEAYLKRNDKITPNSSEILNVRKRVNEITRLEGHRALKKNRKVSQ